MKPWEIIAAPFDVWLAAVGEAFPYVDAIPEGNWVRLGTSGSKNYDEAGIEVDESQTLEDTHTLGSTGPVKSFRTKEGLEISLTLLDLSLEQYGIALNGAAVTVVAAAAGIPGSKSIPLRRGSDVTTYALLLRGNVSPDGDGFAMQYQVPKVVEAGSPKVMLTKGKPAGLALKFRALEDPAAAAGEEFGKLVVQTADRTS